VCWQAAAFWPGGAFGAQGSGGALGRDEGQSAGRDDAVRAVAAAEAVAMIRVGGVVVIGALAEVPEHEVLVEELFEDCMVGVALTGPLAGEYGARILEMIVRVLGPQGTYQSLQGQDCNQENQDATRSGAKAPEGGGMSVRIQYAYPIDERGCSDR